METNLLDRMLSTYLDDQSPVTITLQNRIRVTGRIKAFDSYVVVLEGQRREVVYRHAMSCIAPASAEHKRETAPPRPAAPAGAKPARQASSKIKAASPPAVNSSSPSSINSSMKEGLLKWMQGQKAAK